MHTYLLATTSAKHHRSAKHIPPCSEAERDQTTDQVPETQIQRATASELKDCDSWQDDTQTASSAQQLPLPPVTAITAAVRVPMFKRPAMTHVMPSKVRCKLSAAKGAARFCQPVKRRLHKQRPEASRRRRSSLLWSPSPRPETLRHTLPYTPKHFKPRQPELHLLRRRPQPSANRA